MTFFDMKDLGEAKSFLGIQLTRDRDAGIIYIDQEKYIRDLLVKFQMTECNPISTPMDTQTKLSKPEENDKIDAPYQELIGSLLFLSRITRPDIIYAINYLSRFNNCFGKEHWIAAKRVLRYLKGTINRKIAYSKNAESISEICGFSDADFANDPVDRRSTTGFVFIMAGGAITWNSRKQPTIALSTTEAEYMAMSLAVQEVLWLETLKAEILPKAGRIILHVDNQSALQLAKNATFHNRTKHIDVKHHFVRAALEEKKLELKYICTKDMTADLFTKALAKPAIEHHMKTMGMMEKF